MTASVRAAIESEDRASTLRKLSEGEVAARHASNNWRRRLDSGLRRGLRVGFEVDLLRAHTVGVEERVRTATALQPRRWSARGCPER